MITYKYRTREAALYDLLEESVYFSSPAEFHETNDQLEGKFEILTSKSLWRIILQAINEIERNRNGRTLVHSIPSYFTNSIAMSNEKFIKQAKEVGICSTSKTFYNQAMWSHYCKNEGLCFEYEWDPEIIEERNLLIKNVAYSDKPKIINRDDLFKKMIIEYGIEHPKSTINSIIEWSLSEESSTQWMKNFILESTCAKKKCWSYEEEIRLLAPKAKSFNILKRILRSIYVFIPRFNSAEFLVEFEKSRVLRLIFSQIVEKYSCIKLYGLCYDQTGKLNVEEIPFD